MRRYVQTFDWYCIYYTIAVICYQQNKCCLRSEYAVINSW